jgi:very-short-patch-repair endonuclease
MSILSYDPYTLRQLRGAKRLPRQRMDFLMLLPHESRIVLEIDGRHHYALDNGQASPPLYAEMVAEDRRLKLAGYDIYHFGGYEFSRSHTITEMIEGFFQALFE